MFICKRCRINKPETDFYPHNGMARGYLSYCKDCVKLRVHNYQEMNIEKIRAADREYGRQPETKARLKGYMDKYKIKYPPCHSSIHLRIIPT